MAEQAFPDGDLAHPCGPNAYGPGNCYPVRSSAIGLVPSSPPDADERPAKRDEARGG